MRALTTYRWHTGKLKKAMRIALVSDLHDAEYDDIWPLIEGADCLLVPGDVVNRYRKSYQRGLAFLNEAADRLPTFFSLGNHEIRLKCRAEMLEALKKSKATILINRYTRFGPLCIGGWYRPKRLHMPDMLDSFEKQPEVKVLMCHRPEDYFLHLEGRAIDLVVAGHAHGGQFRFGEQGLYAPGQGFFPKYTKGIAGRMVISTGASNPARMPRFRNPCEVVMIHLE